MFSFTDYLSYAHFYWYKQSDGDSCKVHMVICVVAVCISDTHCLSGHGCHWTRHYEGTTGATPAEKDASLKTLIDWKESSH
jgi:hypothetical protein